MTFKTMNECVDGGKGGWMETLEQRSREDKNGFVETVKRCDIYRNKK